MPDMTKADTLSKAAGPRRAEPSEILAVIPALNEARHIETCIRSLMTGAPALREVPLVVADGGSSDETVAIVHGLKGEFPNLRVLPNPRRLQSAALNLASEVEATAKTRVLVRCDAHSIYPENFILDVAQSMLEHGAASLVIPMDAVGETPFETANALIVDTPLGSGGARHRGGKVSGWVDHGHHAGFDIGWYRQIGGYDETFAANEDAEYDARLARAGGRIYLDAGIRIKYIPRGSVSRLWKQYEGYGRGLARNLRKHGSALKLRQAIPIVALVGSVAGTLASLVYWPAIVLPLGYLAILACASVYVALRHRTVWGLYAGLAAGTMHMSWATGYLKEALSRKG